MIYILSAPIQSGKTTSLIQWSETRKDVHGILTPVVNGKRVFMNAQTKEQFPMEAEGEEETLAIGRFVFSKAGFDKAIQVIKDAITQDGWLVIDEIGPMELKDEGFSEVLKETLALKKEKIVLVVREGIADLVTDHFGILNPELIKNPAFIRVG